MSYPSYNPVIDDFPKPPKGSGGGGDGRQSSNRAVALTLSVKFYAHRNGTPYVDDVVRTADKFLAYLEGREVR